MKTRNLTTIAATFLMLFLSLAYSFGQVTTPPTQPSVVAPHLVGVNSTHIYDVAYTVRSGGTVPNVYTWTINIANSSYTITGPAVAGVNYTIAAGADQAIQNIKWLVAGYYVIQLQENNPAGYGSCPGPMQTLDVFVGPTGSVQFQSATGTNQCSAAGGYNLTLTYTGTISYPISVNVQYTINGATSTATIAVANAGATLDIPAGVNFLSSLTDDISRSVQITGVTDSYGGDLTIGATATSTLTIWSIPATTTIHRD